MAQWEGNTLWGNAGSDSVVTNFSGSLATLTLFFLACLFCMISRGGSYSLLPRLNFQLRSGDKDRPFPQGRSGDQSDGVDGVSRQGLTMVSSQEMNLSELPTKF